MARELEEFRKQANAAVQDANQRVNHLKDAIALANTTKAAVYNEHLPKV